VPIRPGRYGHLSQQTIRIKLGTLRTFFERVSEWDCPDAPQGLLISTVTFPPRRAAAQVPHGLRRRQADAGRSRRTSDSTSGDRNARPDRANSPTTVTCPSTHNSSTPTRPSVTTPSTGSSSAGRRRSLVAAVPQGLTQGRHRPATVLSQEPWQGCLVAQADLYPGDPSCSLFLASCCSCHSYTPGSQSLPNVADGPIRGSLGLWASRKACTYARSSSIRART